jgi:N6-adenosine-specific RNA methylase IME4
MAMSLKHKVVLADPPWNFRHFSVRGEARSAHAHYACMTIDEIKSLPVADLADKDAVLFLWCPDTFLPQGMEVIEAWGFEFKTVAFYWAKLNKLSNKDSLSESDFFTGLGYWTRANPEQCLLATRGRPSRKSRSVKRLIVSPRREHSRKPDEIYSRIEALCDGPYLELFARETRAGWTSIGDEVGVFESGTASRIIPSSLANIPTSTIEKLKSQSRKRTNNWNWGDVTSD